MQGCTEPSSTFQPYALAIQAHNITDPIGANANARSRKSASKYQNHGKRFRRSEGGGFISPSSNLYPQMDTNRTRIQDCSQIRRRCSHVAACHAEVQRSGCAI